MTSTTNDMAKRSAAKNGNGANLGFEEKPWAAADRLRGHMNAAENKHVLLGLVFLKDISDAFQELHDALVADKFRDRRGETLFIDARKLGSLVDRTHREMSEDEITRIARTYHAWRGEKDAGKYEDIDGFCKSASLEEITSHGHVLTPGRYIGAEETEDDDDMPFDERMEQSTARLKGRFAESAKLEKAILRNLASLGFTGSEKSEVRGEK